jgi:hypothetical protein
MNKLLVLINYFVILTSIYPQENTVNERLPFVVKLSIDEENYWEWEVPQSPYIINNNFIQFYPGETICMEATVIDNIITQLTVVKEILNNRPV